MADLSYEARAIVLGLLEMTLTDLAKQIDHPLAPEDQVRLFHVLHERARERPLAKILGYKYFWKDKFIVNEDVLDPRPETELIIETGVKYVDIRSSEHRSNQSLKILDLGTGSGCILLSMLREFPNSTGIGIDISENALKIARDNRSLLDLNDRADFFCGNWFDPLESQNRNNNSRMQFDIIVANPPYVSHDENINNGAKYDPEIALFADDNGLSEYKKIIPRVGRFLEDYGIFICEIGHTQANSIKKIFEESEFCIKHVETIKDLSGHDRVIVGEKYGF